jgi:O-antigen/teichoic acid export membrane protein
MARARGTLILTAAQAWHALSGYLVFVAVARALGQARYGDFTVVLWTVMTTEAFITEGVPRAVSYFTAQKPESARSLVHAGLLHTGIAAVAAFGGLVLLAPWIASSFWGDPALAAPVRLLALDIPAFLGFAVLAQAINGLHRFNRQAVVWFGYSTLKLVAVLVAARLGTDLGTVLAGYVIASIGGSLVAVLLGWGPVRQGTAASSVAGRELWTFGFPVALQALLLLVLVNLDLWMAKGPGKAGGLALGAYGAAATLARALHFIFRGFADALFPAVARALAAGDAGQARRSTRKAISLLLGLLLPAVGLATGTARVVLPLLFGEPGYADGAEILHGIGPAAAGWTLTALLVALLSAAGRERLALGVLAAMAAITMAVLYGAAVAEGPAGIARSSGTMGLVSALVSGLFVRRILGRVVAVLPLLGGIAGAFALHFALEAWCPASWWVFPYGALLYGLVLLGLHLGGAWPLFGRGET